MTALLGYDDGERVWLAADRRSSSGGGHHDEARKLMILGAYEVAVAGSEMFAGHLRQLAPTLTPTATAWEICSQLRAHLRAEGWKGEFDKADYPTFEAGLLLAGPDGLFSCGCALSPGRIPVGRWEGIGSGWERIETAALAIQRYRPEMRMELVVHEAFKVAAERCDSMSPACDLVVVERAVASAEEQSVNRFAA